MYVFSVCASLNKIFISIEKRKKTTTGGHVVPKKWNNTEILV